MSRLWSPSRLVRFLATALLLLLAVPLRAQLNPKWQKPGTDFLDMYQQSTVSKLKPEILAILDMSGSMGRMMFHKDFQNNYLNEEGQGGYKKAFFSFKIILAWDTDGNVTGVNLYMRNTNSGGWGTEPLTDTQAKFTGNQLIKPDGTAVTVDDVSKVVTDATLPGTEGGVNDVRNWVRCASHARFVVSGGTWVGSGVTRTVDLPLHWAILDTTSRAATPKIMQIKDPKGSATTNPYDFDSTYRVESSWGDKTVGWMQRSWSLSGSGSALTRATDSKAPSQETSTEFVRPQGGGDKLALDNWEAVFILGGDGTWRWDYLKWILTAKDSAGYYVIGDAADATKNASGRVVTAFDNGVPNVTRLQAVKMAILRTWFNYQDKVFLCFRALYNVGCAYGESNGCSAEPGNNDVPKNNYTQWKGNDWVLMSPKNDHAGARMIAKYICSGSTALTRSYTDGLAQMQQLSPWQSIEKGEDSPVQCTKHFLLLFTDGVPTDDGDLYEDKQPYSTGAQKGNQAVYDSQSSTDCHGAYWNLPTLAGIAAHLGDVDITPHMPGKHVSSSGNTSKFLPFSIVFRGNEKWYARPHAIQTMTIGVSLGWNLTNPSDTDTPDYRLRCAAAAGNPKVTDYNFSNLKVFDPYAVVQDPGAVYYFNGSDPQRLVDSLDRAFLEIYNMSNQNSVATPTIPFVGVGLGHQIYLARFKPNDKGGPVWTGDLMMFATKEVNGQTVMLNSSGTPIDSDLTVATPGWSAAESLRTLGWSNRRVFTRLPAGSSDWNPPIQALKVSKSDSEADPAEFTAVKSYVPYGAATTDTAKDANRRFYLRWLLGADTSVSTLPTRGASGASASTPDIMGDIVDASPAAIEYTITKELTDALPSNLATTITAKTATVKDEVQTTPRFRIIFAGSNQGFLHAFGEVSWDEKQAATTDRPAYWLAKGVVQELWAFVPTEVLQYCDYFHLGSNPHRFAVNGVPQIYHLDLAAAGKINGNGKIDPKEWAQVIFGLGKGGRSYYALDIRDPMNPKLGGTDSIGWSLCPDEAESVSTTRCGSDSNATVLQNMGYSTSIPAVGRVVFEDKLKDVVFLGGGLSHSNIETTTTTGTTYLGRSVVALEVNTGKVLRIWDLSSSGATVGPIVAGVVPFKLYPATGMVQRLYFSDMFGTLWSINGTGVGTGDYAKFRVDTSNMSSWSSTPRPVYRQHNGTTLTADAIMTTVPAPFRVGSYYARKTKPLVAPAAVGIALMTGNRNDPMDLGYSDTKAKPPYNAEPTQHRITVVFDRQDSNMLGLDTSGIQTSQLEDMSNQTDLSAASITLGSQPEDTFYLSRATDTRYGYYINFPARSTTIGSKYVPKGIIAPLVITGVGFYSYFTPTAINPCTGGSGKTYTMRICDIMRPVTGNDTLVNNCTNNQVAEWWGLASNISPKSVVAAIQAGITGSGDLDPATGRPKNAALQTRTFAGSFSSQFASPRTWRTVH